MKKFLNLTTPKISSSLLKCGNPKPTTSVFTSHHELSSSLCINQTQKRFGSKPLNIRGKLLYQKKLQVAKKFGKQSEKSKTAVSLRAQQSLSYNWSPSTKTEEIYQQNMLEFKKSAKRPSAQQLIDMLSTVSSYSDLNHAMSYWRTLCLKRIKFTIQSTDVLLKTIEKYDEQHPSTAIELLKNAGRKLLNQPLTRGILRGFIEKLVLEHNDLDNAVVLFNELKLNHYNLTIQSEDFEWMFSLLKKKEEDSEVPKEKYIELFDKQPRPERVTDNVIECNSEVLKIVFNAYQEVGEGLDGSVKKRVLTYLRDQALGKNDCVEIYDQTRQLLLDMRNKSSTEGGEETKEE
ncbi:hypothetical protein ABK040_014839 [Willaertia magna]